VSALFHRRREPRRVPKRPYRDSALLSGALAAVIVVVAAATGGSLLRAVLFAVGFFALAMAWSWYRWRERVREDRRT
jgi:hypothetical protein